jgi:hypothetical protein
MISRRNLSLYLAGGTAALLAAGCTPGQVTDVEKQVANLIQQVQAGVAAGCASLGKLIPTANSVIALLAGLAGSTNPAVVTAAIISQAISSIVGAACKSDDIVRGPRETAVSGVKIDFY